MTAVHDTARIGNTRYDSFKASMDPAIYPLTLYYESACPLCNAEMSNLMLRNTGGHLLFADVSAPDLPTCPRAPACRTCWP